jgi:hypothetical protein
LLLFEDCVFFRAFCKSASSLLQPFNKINKTASISVSCHPLNQQRIAQKCKRPSTEGLFVLHAATRGRQRMQGLAVTLAGVLLAASCNTTFQADALTAACSRQGVAWQGLGCGSGFAVGFGKDFVAHVAILLRLV